MEQRSEVTKDYVNLGISETEQSRKVRENFQIFGVATFIYSCIYAFCTYHNVAGVTYPLFVIASLVYIRYCMKHLDITVKKGTVFYEISTMLLGISTFCTADMRIIMLNKMGVFLLLIAMILSNVFDTKSWGLGKYISAIIQSVIMAIGEVAYPVRDVILYCKSKMGKRSKTFLYVIISFVVTIPVFSVVLMLLVSADAVFGNMAINLLEGIRLDNVIGVLWKIGFLFFLAYGILSFLCKKSIREKVEDSQKGEPLLAIPMLGLLSLLYLMFSVVQIAGLFLGKMELPSGYTYAEYAREGFFQLLVVSILNLVLVLAGMRFFRKHKVLDILLTLMSACTFIMIASSAMRMILYIQTYHLTFLRIFVLWSLFVLTSLFVGVIVSLYKKQFSLFRYSMVVVTVCYLVLSFSHPDYWIATYNVQKIESAAVMEDEYLRTLSADAAPVLAPYFDEAEATQLWYEEEANSIRKFNVSHFIANQMF